MEDRGEISAEWRVQSGECRVESGEWRVESGEYRVESTEWRVQSGECRVESTEVRGKSFCSLSLALQTVLGVIHRVSLWLNCAL